MAGLDPAIHAFQAANSGPQELAILDGASYTKPR